MLTFALAAAVCLLGAANIVVARNEKTLRAGNAYLRRTKLVKTGIDSQKTALMHEIDQGLNELQEQESQGQSRMENGVGESDNQVNSGLQHIVSETAGLPPVTVQRLAQLKSEINYLSKKSETIDHRLEKLERVSPHKGSANTANLYNNNPSVRSVMEANTIRKIAALDEFRRNALIEIEALKQKVYNQQDLEKKPTFENKKLEERIRQLAFNVQN